MNVKKHLSVIFLITVLSACDNNTSTDKELDPQSTTTVTDTPKDTSKSTLPGANTITTNSNLNPEHGQPGHRCDLAVGAPLNSKPPAITTQPAPVNQPQLTNPKSTIAAGMNPEHGMPGHRCDINVGTPLSQPVKKVP